LLRHGRREKEKVYDLSLVKKSESLVVAAPCNNFGDEIQQNASIALRINRRFDTDTTETGAAGSLS